MTFLSSASWLNKLPIVYSFIRLLKKWSFVSDLLDIPATELKWQLLQFSVVLRRERGQFAILLRIRELKRATFLSHGRQPEVCCFPI